MHIKPHKGGRTERIYARVSLKEKNIIMAVCGKSLSDWVVKKAREDFMKTLCEIAGQESGAVVYPDGSVMVCNWSGIDGIPREFATGLIGLNENLDVKTKKVNPPAKALAVMHDDEKDNGLKPYPDHEYNAIELIGMDIIIVTHPQWH